MDTDVPVCIDINECENNPCRFFQKCINMAGSYTCILNEENARSTCTTYYQRPTECCANRKADVGNKSQKTWFETFVKNDNFYLKIKANSRLR